LDHDLYAFRKVELRQSLRRYAATHQQFALSQLGFAPFVFFPDLKEVVVVEPRALQVAREVLGAPPRVAYNPHGSFVGQLRESLQAIKGDLG
jgi:hypothetical protein